MTSRDVFTAQLQAGLKNLQRVRPNALQAGGNPLRGRRYWPTTQSSLRRVEGRFPAARPHQ